MAETTDAQSKNLPGCCVDRLWAERNRDDPSPARRRDAKIVADKACTPSTCMMLPEGKTCGDCVHIKRCEAIFGHTPTDRSCDFFPRRFLERAVYEKTETIA